MTGGETPRLLTDDADGLHKVTVLRYDPANDRLLGGALDGSLVVVDALTGQRSARVATRMGAVQAVRPSPSGALAVALDATGHVMLWRPSDGMLLGLLGVEGARDAWWSDDATLWIANQGLERWEIGTAAPYRWEELGGVGTLAVSPDGLALAEGVGPYLTERTLSDGAVRRSARQHERVIKAAVYQDAETVLSVAAVGPTAFQRLGPGPDRVPPTAPGLRRLVSSDGFFFGADYGRGVHIWSGPEDVGHRVGLPQAVTDLVASNGEGWAIDGTGAVLRLSPEGRSVVPVAQVSGASALAMAKDGSRLGVYHAEQVALYHLPDLAPQAEWPVGPDLTALALSPDGGRLAVGYIDGHVALWSEQGLVWTAPGHTDRVSALTFVGDGIVSASWDASVRRWALDPLASVGASAR
jgi:WD40 repeat protein